MISSREKKEPGHFFDGRALVDVNRCRLTRSVAIYIQIRYPDPRSQHEAITRVMPLIDQRELPYVMGLVRQSLEKQLGNGADAG